MISVKRPRGAFGTDKEAGQVIPGGGFSCPGGGGDRAAVRSDDFQCDDVVLHGAVPDRVGAGSAGCDHAADGRVRAGIDREEESVWTERVVELGSGDSGLNGAIEVIAVDFENRVHP